jgi:general secretion pathway protein L
MLSVGVDIGTYSIKIADVEPTSKSYAIRRVLEIPLSLDLTKDRKIQIIDALRTLFAQYDLEKTQFVFALPQKMVSSRLLHLPFRERFKVQKAIVAMLEDELPMQIEDSVFEAKIVRMAGKGAEVLAMAAPRERVSDVLNLAHDCGVEPQLISADGVAFYSLFERWWEPPVEGLEPAQDVPAPKNADLILNIGHLGTELLVMSEGTLIGSRNVDWGGKNIADALGTKYGLNYIQAMRELQTKGSLILDKSSINKEQLAFSQVIEESLQVLLADLRLKLLELQSEMNLHWGKGLLVGGVSQLKNLNGYLTQHLQIAFNRYKQFEHHPTVNFEYTPHLEAVTGVAVGLAIEGIRRPRNPATNFLKGDLAKQAHFFETVWEKWGYTAQLMGAAFVAFLTYAMIRDSLALSLLDESEKVLKTQAQAVAGLPARQASASKIRKFIAAQEALEKGRRQAEKVLKMNSALDVAELISSSMPAKSQTKLEVKRLSVQNDQAEVHGHTPTDYDKESIARALQKAAVGAVSPITSRAATPAGKVPFAFKFRVARQAGG